MSRARVSRRPKRARKTPSRLIDQLQADAGRNGGAKRRKSSFAIDELRSNESPYEASKNSKQAAASTVFGKRAPLPTRNARNELIFADHKEFRPNKSPQEVMQAGSFGGTYWRPIKSAVTGLSYKNEWKEFPEEWFEGLDPKKQLTRAWKSYSKAANKYGVKCGGTLDMWESSGWITAQDPYGWFQWYCRFYLGRRSSDDERQIKRWRGVCSNKGRFRNQLIGRCARKHTTFDDFSVSPVIRQAILHWGYELTERDADAYVKLKGLPALQKKNKKKDKKSTKP